MRTSFLLQIGAGLRRMNKEKMAHVVRPLMQQRPRWHHHCRSSPVLLRLFNSPSLLFSTNHSHQCPFFTSFPFSQGNSHFQQRGLRFSGAGLPSDLTESVGNENPNVMKSRNQKKREAQRAVRWGMDLSTFSPRQIKRILRVASLEEEVFDALMLVKRLGPDVREGKRRQFNYIGKLLREVRPKLMDDLIQAAKLGDESKFQDLAGSETFVTGNDNEELEANYNVNEEEEEEGSCNHIDAATRWFDGLINKDIQITNEIYSIHNVEFDRQELRRLVRKVHSLQERRVTSEENAERMDATLMCAKRSLTSFLRTLAKQLTAE